MEQPASTARRWIALLRAINVGGHTVKMSTLRALFEALGFTKVETFIASGNVIFETAAESTRELEQQIAAQLQAALGYPVATFIRSPAELAASARHRPFPAAELEQDGSTLYIAFLPTAPAPQAQQRLLALQSSVDALQVHGREVYWLARRQLGESSLSGAALEKALGIPATVRNITTVAKLAVKYAAAH